MAEHKDTQFGKAYRELHQAGAIGTKSEMAARLKTYCHMVNGYMVGKRNVTVAVILKMKEEFNINPMFLLGLEDEIYYEPRKKSDGPY